MRAIIHYHCNRDQGPMRWMVDHIEARHWSPQQSLTASGFGQLKSRCPFVPVDFDAASLLRR